MASRPLALEPEPVAVLLLPDAEEPTPMAELSFPEALAPTPTAAVFVPLATEFTPTAVEKSPEALRRAYPGRRVLALFEPRSLTAGRALFFDAYARAFAHADVLLLAPIFHHERLGDQRLDVGSLLSELIAAGVDARSCADLDQLFAAAIAEARAGDVIVTMSSGSFDSLPQRLLAAL